MGWLWLSIVFISTFLLASLWRKYLNSWYPDWKWKWDKKEKLSDNIGNLIGFIGLWYFFYTILFIVVGLITMFIRNNLF